MSCYTFHLASCHYLPSQTCLTLVFPLPGLQPTIFFIELLPNLRLSVWSCGNKCLLGIKVATTLIMEKVMLHNFYTSLTSDLHPTKSNPLNLLVSTWLFALDLNKSRILMFKCISKVKLFLPLNLLVLTWLFASIILQAVF